jgi:glycosyltransferase involved in cell wall biosynthesis
VTNATVVFVHPSDELYGADRCLLALVRGRPAATRIVVILPQDIQYDGPLSAALTNAGAEVRRLDYAVLRRAGLRPASLPTLARRLTVGTWELARLIRDLDATTVHTNTLASVSGPLAALLARRAHVWHVHEMIADEHPGVRLAYRLLALLPGRLIANSRATARALAGPIWPLRRKMRVVYPGHVSRIESERRPSSLDNNALRIAFAGRLTPRKGVRELLEAVVIVRERAIPLRLSIFGSPPPGREALETEYRHLAARLGLGDIVTFEGFVPDAVDRLGEFDVLVVPSQRPESFGLVAVEGMAAGCAVVACRNGGGSDEILEHGRSGLYCGRAPSSIAAAIVRLAEDPALRTRLGRNAQRAAIERFGVDRYQNAVWVNRT